MFSPKLRDLIVCRWYSIGDCRAEKKVIQSGVKVERSIPRSGKCQKRYDDNDIPFKKLRCDSKICLMSFSQHNLISGDNAYRINRCVLPSTLRDVNTNRDGSSVQRSSMPKQLTYKRYNWNIHTVCMYQTCSLVYLGMSLHAVSHFDAIFIDVSWQGKAFLAVDWFTKDDKLLEEEDSSLFGTGE